MAQSFLDWPGLKPGPQAVGFKAVATTDATRSFQTPTDYQGRPRATFGNRPVQISMWYPAAASSNPAYMAFGDYVTLLAWELGPRKTAGEDRAAAERQFIQQAGSPGTPESAAAFAQLFRDKVWARQDAPPATGKFPVLIYAPGQGYPAFDNSVLAEYLASYGFIVLTSPSCGPNGRDMPDNPGAIDTGARDLEFLMGYAQSLPQADAGRIATMGFSLGGASAALCTLRNARVRALISLDGVLRDDRYLSQLKAFPQFQPEHLRAPLLWIACAPANSLGGFGDGSFPEQAPYAEVVKAVFAELQHHDFSSMSGLQRRRVGKVAKDWSPATAGYEAACRLIRDFLTSRLNGGPGGLGQEPERVCKVAVRPAAKAPPTPTDFRETAWRDGLPAATELLHLVGKEHPELLPSFEEPLVMLGYEALGEAKNELAIGVFALAVAYFPESIDGSYGLGKAYLTTGAFAQAAPHYRSARDKVAKDPNIPAKQKAGILERIDKILADIQSRMNGTG